MPHARFVATLVIMAVHGLRAAIRVTAKRPGFSLAVVLTLALGIGANTAVFSLINAIVLRPLPYPDSSRLYTLFEADSLGTAGRLASYPTFLDWREQSDVFSGLAFIRGTGLTYRTAGEAGLLLGAFVSDEFFPTLGVPALLGRALGPDDYRPGNGNVVVLSHGAWRGTFGGDAGVIGRVVTLANQPFMVIGVMPPDFGYPVWGTTDTDAWLPIAALPLPDLAGLHQRGFHADSRIVARLTSGVPLARAQDQMNAIARRLAAAYPDAAPWTSVFFASLVDAIVGDVPSRLFMLAGAVGVVLLICCVNLANLYLARGAARRQEFAIRAALGARSGQVLRQMLIETLVVASIGGAAGTVFAVWAVNLVRVSESWQLPRASEIGVDPMVLGFAAGLTLLTALVFAAVAVRRGTSPQLAESLGERGATAGYRGGRGQVPAWLLSGQVALTVVLLIAAALLTQTFWRLSRVDPGFDPNGLVAVRINPPSPTYDDPAAVVGLYRRVAESVRAIPGVTDVALINHTPVGSGGLPSQAAIGHVPTGSTDDIRVLYETVSAGYFTMMGIPILAGREFNPADLDGPPGPLIVSETLARSWGGRSPVGDRLGVLRAAKTRADFGQPLVGTVVGVVGDVRHFGLDTEPPPIVYVPYTHNPWDAMAVVARTGIAAELLVTPLEQAIRQVDPAIPLKGPGLGATTFDDSVRGNYASQRLNAILVSGFAVVALFLAAVGIYGVLSYLVTLETREIGIRMALGAAPWSVLRAIVGRVARITVGGLLVGVAGALALTRLIRGLLYRVEPTDPVTYVGVSVLLLIVALLAGLNPARRAAGVDPVTALRQSP